MGEYFQRELTPEQKDFLVKTGVPDAEWVFWDYEDDDEEAEDDED